MCGRGDGNLSLWLRNRNRNLSWILRRPGVLDPKRYHLGNEERKKERKKGDEYMY